MDEPRVIRPFRHGHHRRLVLRILPKRRSGPSRISSPPPPRKIGLSFPSASSNGEPSGPKGSPAPSAVTTSVSPRAVASKRVWRRFPSSEESPVRETRTIA